MTTQDSQRMLDLLSCEVVLLTARVIRGQRSSKVRAGFAKSYAEPGKF